jgi:hypothetical protein
VVRPDRLSIALSVLALIGVVAPAAQADITVTVPGLPTVTVPGVGSGALPDVHVTVPTDGSTPTVTVGPGTAGPVSTPPVSTPPVSTPPVSTPPVPPLPATTPAAQPQATTAPPSAAPKRPATAAATSTPAASGRTAAGQTRSAGRHPPRPRHGVTRTTTIAPRNVGAVHERTRPTTRTHAPATKAPPAQSHPPGGVGTAIGGVVDELPGWVLSVFLSFAALAAAMAVKAYTNSRRAGRLAVQRAELVDDVGQLQAALLAPLPAPRADVSFSVAYRPAAGLAAGGDFYDVFELDAERTALLIGDVSGHGRESLTQAALVRYTLRTFIAAGHGPAEAIALTDPCLDGHMDGHFATVIAAVYDHATRTLTYANAGHHPPLVLGVEDTGTIEAASPPVGVGLEAQPSDVTLHVPADATVCFFTDGLVEARRRGTALGTDRVHAMLVDAPDDAEALLASVASEADEINDDLAVCLLHRPVGAPSVAATATATPRVEPVSA